MTEAQRHCRENYMDLATIRDLEDLETLKTLKTPIQSVSFMTPVTGGLRVLQSHSEHAEELDLSVYLYFTAVL